MRYAVFPAIVVTAFPFFDTRLVTGSLIAPMGIANMSGFVVGVCGSLSRGGAVMVKPVFSTANLHSFIPSSVLESGKQRTEFLLRSGCYTAERR